ncbi:MAG: rhodanese-like domain-containing protein [Pseudomonadota bacterium]
MTRILSLRTLLIAGAAVLVAGGAVIAMEPQLSKIHKRIEADYADVSHIEAETFAALNDSDVVIFDVREPAEFAVSHIEGAIQVDPGIKPEAFATLYGDKLSGKTAVFYCSVGRRSSALAERVADVLPETGAAASYNLVGGLFQWRNDSRPLTTMGGAPTDAIHPYNNHWGRLIEDKTAITYSRSTFPRTLEQ